MGEIQVKESFVQETTVLDLGHQREILKLDESCSSNLKSRNIRLDGMSHEPSFRGGSPVQLKISDLGLELQDSSNFKICSRAPLTADSELLSRGGYIDPREIRTLYGSLDETGRSEGVDKPIDRGRLRSVSFLHRE